MSPWLSVVVAARNDNYGGDFLHRLQAFTEVLLGFGNRLGLSAELVIVEWNPPPDRPPLAEALRLPAAGGTCETRILTVSPELHRQRAGGGKLPMYEYLAKNVGLRRARGTWVLVTNPDVLLSADLVAVLAGRQLEPGCFYRADRYDFVGPSPLDVAPEEIVRQALGRVFQVHARESETLAGRIDIGPLARWLARWNGRWPGSAPVGATAVRGAVSLPADGGLYGGIHTNAAGDFLLAEAAAWARMRGFPERTDTFTHLDSYGAHQLHALGLKQMLFLPPCMILHADHARPAAGTRPVTGAERWRDELAQLREGRLGPALNPPGWGMGDQSLAETVLAGAASAAAV